MPYSDLALAENIKGEVREEFFRPGLVVIESNSAWKKLKEIFEKEVNNSKRLLSFPEGLYLHKGFIGEHRDEKMRNAYREMFNYLDTLFIPLRKNASERIIVVRENSPRHW